MSTVPARGSIQVLRYECWRMKHAAQESRFLVLLAQRGIEEPLEGVAAGESFVLINGFIQRGQP